MKIFDWKKREAFKTLEIPEGWSLAALFISFAQLLSANRNERGVVLWQTMCSALPQYSPCREQGSDANALAVEFPLDKAHLVVEA